MLRHNQRLVDMVGGNNVSESTVRRWRDELTALLASQAPRLDRALKNVTKQGVEVALVDGTLIPPPTSSRPARRPPTESSPSDAHRSNTASPA
ncbi:hypothetical protein [Streptomyces sp. NPDC059278]|uniref:hypothetical protein n=1 Tax=Streptomyces sp. NPDC059278 TaxID=3346801 RepID=UPI0036B39464